MRQHGAVTIFFVRHAKAGSRSRWDQADWLRPLEDDGIWQAEQIADYLADKATGLVTSSPYVRCMQTVEPLAARLGTEVVPIDLLAEGARFTNTLDLLSVISDGAVLCSHGDVIPEAVDALIRRGAEMVGAPDTRKGCIWELERHGHTIARMRAIAPPRRSPSMEP
jgi:8-oxo-dGTP diphosphatase